MDKLKDLRDAIWHFFEDEIPEKKENLKCLDYLKPVIMFCF